MVESKQDKIKSILYRGLDKHLWQPIEEAFNLLCDSTPTIQEQVHAWHKRNFGNHDKTELHMTLGVCEEAGELAHAVLKKDQGIRGAIQEHEAEMKDAMGDIAIYMMNICALHGWDLFQIIQETADEVMKRDWTRYHKDGKEGG